MSTRGTFGREHVALLTANEAAALDREARERHDVPARVLMENAGRSAALVVQRLFPSGRVIAVLGSGNNGGDALVLLRNLLAWGRDVAYLQAGSKPPVPDLFHGFDIPRIDYGDAVNAFAAAAVLVDGILGTGATGAPREPAAGVIRAMNASGRPIVALDIPTGVDPTTGDVPGDVVDADVTLQFGWPKLGALQQPGRGHCGRIVAVEIAFPPLQPEQAGAALITPAWAVARLPARPQDAHKNMVGRLFVLAGHPGMSGAAVIAGRSAVRAGVGYTWVASPEANRTILQLAVSEAIFVDREDESALREAVSSADAVLAGPGIGTDAAAERALDVVLDAFQGPCVLDADALNILSQRDGALRELARARPLLVTPHPGEMSRLTGASVADIQKDRLGAARAWVEDHGATLLLKGAPSIVASPDAPVLMASTGSSDLASAGMGDMLSGTIGAFLAGGCTPRDAAGLGLFYGGRASELAGRHRGLSPNDVSDALHAAFADPGPAASPLDLPFVNFDQPPRW
ncbi:MAG: NAD(P)H-hydrate dehydratase [Gemmatimonadota bacterium]